MSVPADVRLKIDAAVKKAGYWYPPDVLDAVVEGRDEFHPLDASITYCISRLHGLEHPVAGVREFFERLLDKHWPGWRER